MSEAPCTSSANLVEMPKAFLPKFPFSFPLCNPNLFPAMLGLMTPRDVVHSFFGFAMHYFSNFLAQLDRL